jgi:ureidoacrylate peracid hydrolase
MAAPHLTTRDVPLDPQRSAILYIDVQNFSVRRDGGEFAGLSQAEMDEKYGYYFDRLESLAIPNMQKLQSAFLYGDRKSDQGRPRPQP